MSKITLHRALSKLKVLDKQISKEIVSLRPIGVVKGESTKVNGEVDQVDFAKDARSKYQSIRDSIKFKAVLKALIVKANAETKVKIGDEEMTIADAITRKSIIDYEKDLLETLKSEKLSVDAAVNKGNVQVHDNALALAREALSNDSLKITDDSAKAIMQPYIKSNELNRVDPLDLKEVIENLEKSIDNFESEVDSVLSEVNATTMIEVPD